ncbi:MAG: ATPase, T2SS/T4P/T4SS family [Chloroflexota bacterium]
MVTDLTVGLVRILTPNGETAGAGFILTDSGLIATCAHVVHSAGAGPGDTVRLVFHHTGDEATASVEPDGWRDPKAEDVAILRLHKPLPEGVKPLPLGPAVDTANHSFETFGFPTANPDEGLWGKGEILRETAIGGVRVLQLRSQEVTPGFSGAPLWDTTFQGVVGLVTVITDPDPHGRLAQTAFATPSETLLEVWPDLSDVLVAPAAAIEVEPFVREAVLAYQNQMWLVRPEIPTTPYKFLLPFGLKDQAIFFGRDQALDRLDETLFQARLTILHARSGAGKSSLLNAGLGPRLLAQGYLPIFARTYDNPIAAVIDNIANRGNPPRPRALAEMSLHTFLKLVTAQMDRRIRELIVILDQFEEMFTQVPTPEERRRYLADLASCLEDEGLPLRFVWAIRGDYFSQLAEFRVRLPAIFHNEFYLPQMSAEEVTEAITGPVKQVAGNLTYDEALLDTLLTVLAGDEMDLPELQILCTRLFDIARRKGDRRITLEHYEAAGEAGGILGGYLTQALETFPPEERPLAWGLLTELIDGQGQRRVVARTDIMQQIGGSEVRFNRVLGQLVAGRLVQRTEGECYELAHDYLTTTIKARLGQEDLAYKQIRDLVQREVISWRANRTLIARDRLELIHEHHRLLTRLTAEETELLCRTAVVHQFAVDTWALAAHRQGIDIWPLLQPALKAPDHRVRAGVVAILPVLGEAALPALSQALADEIPLVRVQAIRALERLGADRARQTLAANLRYEVYLPPSGNEPAFYMDRYPVTNTAYELFLKDVADFEPPAHWRGRAAPPDLLDHPVVRVSWGEAQAYATWADKRLPTAREWQRAAGGQPGQRYPWGYHFTPGCCNTREAGTGGTTPVGRYSPGADSPAGVVDMAGNIGSGKTTLLNAIAVTIPDDERIVTLEETAEYRLPQKHVVALESRPPNIEGKGAITLRDLVMTCPHMRPDRIIIGELHGREVFEVLRLMDRGYNGTMATIHADSPQDALEHLEISIKINEPNLPVPYLRSLIGSALDLVVQQYRLDDGKRKVVRITEVLPVKEGDYKFHDVFVFQRDDLKPGKVTGHFESHPVSPGLMRRLAAREIALPPNLLPAQQESQ